LYGLDSKSPANHPDPCLHNDSIVAIDSSKNGQSDYQWKFSSATSGSVNSIDYHIKALEEELGRLKNNVSNPVLREILVSGVTEAFKNNHEASRSLQTKRCLHASSYKSRLGTITYQTRVIKQSITTFGESTVQYKTTTSFIFHPASWLIGIGLRTGIEATAINSQTGWEYSISPVRAVKDDAPIFQFCKLGNITAVQELLKRHASVMDVDSKGWRPLHVSTYST
jgi:hypothetical protein